MGWVAGHVVPLLLLGRELVLPDALQLGRGEALILLLRLDDALRAHQDLGQRDARLQQCCHLASDCRDLLIALLVRRFDAGYAANGDSRFLLAARLLDVGDEQ